VKMFDDIKPITYTISSAGRKQQSSQKIENSNCTASFQISTKCICINGKAHTVNLGNNQSSTV